MLIIFFLSEYTVLPILVYWSVTTLCIFCWLFYSQALNSMKFKDLARFVRTIIEEKILNY